MEPGLDFLLSGLVGALFSLAVLALKVLPNKVTRAEVQEMLKCQPLQFRYETLSRIVEGSQTELKGIWGEIVGLRQDITRLTTTLELTLKKTV